MNNHPSEVSRRLANESDSPDPSDLVDYTARGLQGSSPPGPNPRMEQEELKASNESQPASKTILYPAPQPKEFQSLLIPLAHQTLPQNPHLMMDQESQPVAAPDILPASVLEESTSWYFEGSVIRPANIDNDEQVVIQDAVRILRECSKSLPDKWGYDNRSKDYLKYFLYFKNKVASVGNLRHATRAEAECFCNKDWKAKVHDASILVVDDTVSNTFEVSIVDSRRYRVTFRQAEVNELILEFILQANPQELWFTAFSVNREAVQSLEKAVGKRMCSIISLNLSKSNLSLCGDNLKQILSKLPYLQELYLESCQIKEAFGPIIEGVSALQTLKLLDLKNNKVDLAKLKNGCRARVEELQLSHNHITDIVPLCDALQEERLSLRELNLAWNNLNPGCTERLCSALSSPYSTVQTLNISYCQIRDRDFLPFWNLLTSPHAKLKKLDLEGNNFSARVVINLLSSPNLPKNLEFGYRTLDWEKTAAEPLQKAVKSQSWPLKILDLSGLDIRMGLEIWKMMIDKRWPPHIDDIRLANCGLRDQVAYDIAEVMNRKCWTTVRHVDLTDNFLTRLGFNTLCGVISKMPQRLTIWLDNNKFQTTEEEEAKVAPHLQMRKRNLNIDI